MIINQVSYMVEKLDLTIWKSWYLGNGFDEVIEQKDYENPILLVLGELVMKI